MTSPKPLTGKDHLDFYLEHDISPVRQDISDLQKHLDRRGALYRRLGMPPMFFSGQRVVEVGPGSGHNSIYVASCGPATLDLVEPNPRGRREIAELYGELDFPHTPPNIISERLEEFAPKNEYDIAIAEAWIGVPESEQRLLVKLAQTLRPGGVLITTVSSPIGMLPNTLRRILGAILIDGQKTFDDQTQVLIDAFGSHLDTMSDMSRPHIDWVQDSLHNPGFLTSCLTPQMALKALGPDFSVYESFPRLLTDWRWYKSLHGENCRYNEIFLDAYFSQCHNFLDFQQPPLPAAATETNIALENDCFTLMSLVADYEEVSAPPPQDKILTLVSRIRDGIPAAQANTIAAIAEFETLFATDDITPEAVAGMTAFKPLFGRELMYISIVRDR